MYVFRIYLTSRGRDISFYDMSHSEVFALKDIIKTAESDTLIELPTIEIILSETEKVISMSKKATFVLKSNIAYFEYYKKEESNDS